MTSPHVTVPPGPGARRPGRAARRRRRGQIVFRSLLALVLALLVGAGSFVAGLLAAPVNFDLPPAPRPALLYADDGTTQIATVRPPTRREPVKAEEIPKVMRDAIISAEDERFLEHSGVDVLATVRAAFRDLTSGARQGGSTLTQQYVKNVYVDDDKTLRRKIQEAGLAVRLEQRLSKQQIITDYLNVLYLGNGTYGVQAASKYYFGVPVKDLALDVKTGQRTASLETARASLLAGIAPAPSFYNPVRDLAQAKARQRYTLNRMVVAGFLSSEEASAAYGRGVTPVQATEPAEKSAAPEFTDELKEQLKAAYGGQDQGADASSERDFYGSGLRVRSTLDMQLQTALAQAMREVLPDADDPQAAAVAISISTGDVKAMSTLRRAPARVTPSGKKVAAVTDYARDGTNLATDSFRSTGSTIKPFTLATALENGRSLDDRVSYSGCDTIAQPGKDYRYCNASGEGGSGGRVSLRTALARSINTVYVPLANEVGRDKVRTLALKSGFVVNQNLKKPFDSAPVSFGLGTTAEVTTLSLANSFATLMNGGVRLEPRYFTEVREGGSGTNPGVVQAGAGARKAGTRAMPKDVADQVVEAMSEVATSRGTAPAAAQPFTVYGKTGTTNDSTDARFVGCAKAPQDLCLAVWMGYEYPECTGVQGPCGGMMNLHGVKQVYGGTLPARIFARTFELLRQEQAAAAAPAAEQPVPSASPTPRRTRTRAPEPTRSRPPTATATPTTTTPTTTPPSPRPTTPPPVATTPPATTEPRPTPTSGGIIP